MDIKITCQERIQLNPGARMEDLKWRKCDKPATTFIVISMFGNKVKLQMCEEHRNRLVGLANLPNKEQLLRDAGVPEHVIHNTIKEEARRILHESA